uniref:Uncharacterized protein n=1 Tax=Oryzias melastigma TaxID=30732 RepID=A0A3B3BEE8_ORYME
MIKAIWVCKLEQSCYGGMEQSESYRAVALMEHDRQNLEFLGTSSDVQGPRTNQSGFLQRQ